MRQQRREHASSWNASRHEILPVLTVTIHVHSRQRRHCKERGNDEQPAWYHYVLACPDVGTGDSEHSKCPWHDGFVSEKSLTSSV